MTQIPVYQVDAFAPGPFTGNPAAVCVLQNWIDDALLQAIAEENNLSETAFIVGADGIYQLRWMTPSTEVDLCGHATLAAGWVVMQHLERGRDEVRFSTRRSGELFVREHRRGLAVDLPAYGVTALGESWADPVTEALGARPTALLRAGTGEDKWLARFDSERDVRALRPDFAALAELPARGVIVTARGRDCDFVSRFFCPRVGIDEDPVTGSAHSLLVPYWREELGDRELFARQVSRRTGELYGRVENDRVVLAGRVQPYLTGSLHLGHHGRA